MTTYSSAVLQSRSDLSDRFFFLDKERTPRLVTPGYYS